LRLTASKRTSYYMNLLLQLVPSSSKYETLRKPIWTDFCWILWDFLNLLTSIDETWVHIYYPEPKNNPKTLWLSAPKQFENTEGLKQDVGVCLLGYRYNFTCRLTAKAFNHYGKVVHYTYRQTEAEICLLTSKKAFERNLISSSQMLLFARHPLFNMNCQIFTLKFWNTRLSYFRLLTPP
jgi:hypothetical protein